MKTFVRSSKDETRALTNRSDGRTGSHRRWNRKRWTISGLILLVTSSNLKRVTVFCHRSPNVSIFLVEN